MSGPHWEWTQGWGFMYTSYSSTKSSKIPAWQRPKMRLREGELVALGPTAWGGTGARPSLCLQCPGS